VEPSSGQKDGPDSSNAPGIGIKLMIAILIGVALVALYANVQKVRRDKIEQVIVTPASSATPAAASPGVE
jgi:hypothetical protein